MPKVNSDVLTWARETAGMSPEDAAKALQLKTARGVTGVQRLARLESGEDEPTRRMLLRMASKYRRPLIAFYMPSRPREGDKGADFRRVPDAGPPDFNPRLDALIRNVRARHFVVTALLEEEEAQPLGFVGSCRTADGEAVVAESIRSTIGFELAEFRRASTIELAFRYLRARLEASGIFVMLLGDLGSYHSKISAKAFRGYAIADRIAPFIVINDNDAHAAWSFTAFHEAAHLWLGETGISGASYEAAIERFCNDVAARLLLPSDELAAFRPEQLSSFDASLAAISEFATQRNVSRRMVSYLLLRSRIINAARYQELTDHFYGAWLHSKQKDPEKSDEGGGPNRYTILRHRLGPALLGLARRNLDAGELSPLKASQLLGVNPSAVRNFLHSGGSN